MEYEYQTRAVFFSFIFCLSEFPLKNIFQLNCWITFHTCRRFYIESSWVYPSIQWKLLIAFKFLYLNLTFLFFSKQERKKTTPFQFIPSISISIYSCLHANPIPSPKKISFIKIFGRKIKMFSPKSYTTTNKQKTISLQHCYTATPLHIIAIIIIIIAKWRCEVKWSEFELCFE